MVAADVEMNRPVYLNSRSSIQVAVAHMTPTFWCRLLERKSEWCWRIDPLIDRFQHRFYLNDFYRHAVLDDFPRFIAFWFTRFSRWGTAIINGRLLHFIPPANCTFDQHTFCGWRNEEQGDHFQWSLRSGPTPSRGTGPNADHTGTVASVNRSYISPCCLTSSALSLHVLPHLMEYFKVSLPDSRSLFAQFCMSHAATMNFQNSACTRDTNSIPRFSQATLSCHSCEDPFFAFWTFCKKRPLFLHTVGNGSYVYIEASSPRKHGEWARLTSPTLTSPKHMRFFYHMHGRRVNKLTAYVEADEIATKLWERTGDRGDNWLEGCAQINTTGKFRVCG